jgi:predicted pyridoxine 5'-phosphate oxidase superfamily flavin-nucleotide-binding protein
LISGEFRELAVSEEERYGGLGKALVAAGLALICRHGSPGHWADGRLRAAFIVVRESSLTKAGQMDIFDRLRNTIETAVLCWLATVDAHGQPNVSPKEIFCMGQDPNEILVAEIASPITKRNIAQNPKVCISAIDVFVQKGIKAYGTATLVTPADADFATVVQPLVRKAGPAFTIRAVIRIAVNRVAPIVATSYSIFPERTEAEQRRRAFEAYEVRAAK